MKENISNKSSYNNECHRDGFENPRREISNYKHFWRYFNRYVKLAIICSLLFIVSCKAKKQILVKRVAVDSTAKQAADINMKLNAIRASQNTFTTFSGKAKTKLNIAGNSNDVTLNIRINHDKKIWVSITAIAGIEVARALITPDSILIINRLQSLYIREPFSYIYKFTGDQVNYKTLEALLVGNPIPELLNANSSLQTNNGDLILSGNLTGLLYKLIVGPDMKVTQTNLNDPNTAQTMQVTNNSFIQVGNRVVPSQIDIESVVKDKKIQVNLHYTKMVFDQPLEYLFTIPDGYTPAR